MSKRDENSPSGLTQQALRDHPFVFAPDALRDRVAVISGAGSGIGRAIAWAAARAGARLAICGRRSDPLQETANALATAGHKALALPTNIREPDEIAALFEATEKEFGTIDFLVNCAGGQFPQAALDYSPKGWRAVIETNLTGAWFMMQEAARRWTGAGKPGNIINIVTVVDRGMPGVAHTCAARAGVIGLSKTLALEWAPHDIRINCIAPGTIETEGLKVYPPEVVAQFDKANAQRRLGSAWHIAEACVYLASDASAFTTGDIMTIDGGGRLWGELWLAGKPDHYS